MAQGGKVGVCVKGKRLRRAALAALMLTSSLGMIGVATPAQAQEVARDFNIPAQPLANALTAFGQQSGLQVSAQAPLVEGRTSNTVNGALPPLQALSQLLTGTGLSFRIVGSTVTLEPAPQSTDGAIQLGPVRVEGETSGGGYVSLTSDPIATEGSGSYAVRGVSILKGTESLKDIPQSVTVMTRKQIDDQNLQTLTEALENMPGIYTEKRPGGGTDFYSRGFSSDTIQYDGVPLLRMHSFGNDIAQSTAYLDRIELLRGAQGLLEGAGSPAGSINLVRKRGFAQQSINLEARVGSWDNYAGRIDIGGPLDRSGSIRGRVVGDYEDKQSFLDSVWDRNLTLYAALDIDVGVDTTIGLGLSHARLKGNSATYMGVPRYANGTDAGFARSTFLGADWNVVERRETQLFFDFEHRISTNWSVKASAIYVQDSWDGPFIFHGTTIPLTNSNLAFNEYRYDNSSKNGGLDVHLRGEIDALGVNHEMTLGSNYSRITRDDYFDYSASRRYDVFDFGHDVATPGTYGLSSNTVSDADIRKFGIYGVMRSHVAKGLTAVYGGRLSWYDHVSKSVYSSGFVSSSDMTEKGVFTPYAGLVYELTPDWSTYASYAEIFEPQAETDANRNVLPPMTGVAYEVGLKGSLFGDALNTSLSLFIVDQRNRAVSDFDSDAICGSSGLDFCYRAAGKVRTKGLEIEVHGTVVKGLQVSGGYTYQDNKYLEDENATNIGKPFNYLTPKHILRVWSDYQLPGALTGWTVGLGMTYRSAQFTNFAALTSANPLQRAYSVWNARVGYSANEKFSVSLNINNIFDKDYFSNVSSNGRFNYQGAPRNVLLTLRTKL